MNYWYASRLNEIFLDLDSHRALRRALSVLSVALRTKRLPVKSLWLYRTSQRGHSHLIIVLKRDAPMVSRLAWSLWMGNDRLRAAYVLARQYDSNVLCSGDLLVTRKPYGFRGHDVTCKCEGKHKADEVTLGCSAMRFLLGKSRSADYFSRTGPGLPARKIRIPWGRVSQQQIKRWVTK